MIENKPLFRWHHYCSGAAPCGRPMKLHPQFGAPLDIVPPRYLTWNPAPTLFLLMDQLFGQDQGFFTAGNFAQILFLTDFGQYFAQGRAG